MVFSVDKSSIPQGSTISKDLPGAYYFDSYSFHTEQPNKKSLQIWLDHAAKMPKWINFFMACRNKIVSMMGLKNLGHLGDIDSRKPLDEYRVGDRVGIFTLLYLSDTEILLGESDKHLDVKLSVFKENSESKLISMSTVVHVHNFSGKLYTRYHSRCRFQRA